MRDANLSNTIPPERRNIPGNPQYPAPVGYQPQQGHPPHNPPPHHGIPHSLRGPTPNQPQPIQSGHPIPFNPPPRGPSSQPGMSQYIPRVPSGSLLTTRPRMSYPHPPFSAASHERPRPPTSASWQPPPSSIPGDRSPTATGNIRFPPPQGIRPTNVPQGTSLPPQNYPVRPQMPMSTSQSQAFPHGQAGSDRGNWQPQHFGQGPRIRGATPDQSMPPPHMIPQRPIVPQQPMVAHQPRPAGQPPLQQSPPSQILPQAQQLRPPAPQQLPQQPPRPETPPSSQRLQQPYQPGPPSYEQQFGIGSSQQLQDLGGQRMQPIPQQQPGAYQNPLGRQQAPGQLPHGQRPNLYQQPGQQTISNEQSRSQQIQSPYQQQPPARMPPPNIQQPVQHQIPPVHQQTLPQQPTQSIPQPRHQAPPQHQQPPSQYIQQQQRPGAPAQQQAGQYHQLGPYQQNFPYQQPQPSAGAHHQVAPQQSHQQGFHGPPKGPSQHQGPSPQQGPSQHHQGPSQQPGPLMPPVQGQPPTPYHQLPSSQAPQNLPPALGPQSYQKQPLVQKLSSENMQPQQLGGPFHPASQQRPAEPGNTPSQPQMHEKVPYQISQPDRPVNPSTQLSHTGPAEQAPIQSMDKLPSTYPQDSRSHFQQPYSNQKSESQNRLAPTNPQQQPSPTGVPSNQQWQQQQQQQQQQQGQKYGPNLSQQRTTIPYKITNEPVQDANISKTGVQPSMYPVPMSIHNLSDHPPTISKSGAYLSTNPSSQVGPSATSSHASPQMSHQNRPSHQGDPPGISKPTAYPSPSFQGIHSGPTVSSTYPHSLSSETVSKTPPEHHPNITHDPKPSPDGTPSYPSGLSGQAFQLHPKENQATDNVSKGSSSSLNFSKSLHEFNPTKVVLAKPGALSVAPLSDNPPTSVPKQEPSGSSAGNLQSEHLSSLGPSKSSYSELGLPGSTVYPHPDPSNRPPDVNAMSNLSFVKPKSTIDDKLLENLKSLDLPQSLPSKQPENKVEASDTGVPESTAPEANLPESKSSDSSMAGSSGIGLDSTSGFNKPQPDLSSQGLPATSSQEDVHKLQQKVLLQQQQLIEQQQRFLEQQTLGEHSQVWMLMEQIKQQQKELEDLRSEIKVKDQFGEIEKHLENLERRQNTVETSKSEASKEIGGKKEEMEAGEVAKETNESSREILKIVSERSDGKATSDSGGTPLEKTAQDQLSEITPMGNSDAQSTSEMKDVKEDFLMSQLSQFTLSSSQLNDFAKDSTQPPASKHSNEQDPELQTDVLSVQPPPKPSRAPEIKPNTTTAEKPEVTPPGTSSSPLKTDTLPLGEETKALPHVEVFEPARENEGTPARPIKHRSPPPIPVAYSRTRPEVSHVTRDVFITPSVDANVDDAGKSEEKGEADYITRLADLVEKYRGVVNDLTKRQTRGPNILTKEWLVSLGIL